MKWSIGSIVICAGRWRAETYDYLMKERRTKEAGTKKRHESKREENYENVNVKKSNEV